MNRLEAGGPPGSDMALALRGVSKTFRSQAGGAVPALRNVDLRIARGQFTVLVGPTGCGKTTLLNIVAGIERPDAGRVDLPARSDGGPRVAYVFQHYTLFPWRTLLGNVAFAGAMQGVGRAERRRAAGELLAQVGLAGFERVYPHETSGGMRQRAAIAQALAVQPDLLMMDEPFGALDDATRAELQRLLVRLCHARGATVLFVTHHIEEAVALADRIVVLSPRPGQVVEDVRVELPRPRDTADPRWAEVFLRVRRAAIGDR